MNVTFQRIGLLAAGFAAGSLLVAGLRLAQGDDVQEGASSPTPTAAPKRGSARDGSFDAADPARTMPSMDERAASTSVDALDSERERVSRLEQEIARLRAEIELMRSTWQAPASDPRKELAEQFVASDLARSLPLETRHVVANLVVSEAMVTLEAWELDDVVHACEKHWPWRREWLQRFDQAVERYDPPHPVFDELQAEWSAELQKFRTDLLHAFRGRPEVVDKIVPPPDGDP